MADPVILHFGPLVSPKEASERGLKRYFTGKPCLRGHVAERNLSGGCLACGRVWTAGWKKRNLEHLRSYEVSERSKKQRRAWRDKNRDQIRERRKLYRALYPEKDKESKRKYREKNRGLINSRSRAKQTPYDPQKRIKKQEAKARRPRPEICDICHGCHHRGIVFDHCHASGNFRGWICDRCNKVLGLVKDDPLLLRNMAVYLEKDSGATDDKAKKGSA